MSLVDDIFNAGVVGCGGAGFPTHVKLNTSVETFIVNAAECEPLLRTDRYLMLNKAEMIIEAAEKIRVHLGASRCVIALKSSYVSETASLKKAIDEQNRREISLHFMNSFYPAGDEQTMVYEVTGKIVPPLGIPLDVGCVVSNVGTVYSVFHAMNGRPFIKKYLTVTGEVAKPRVLCVPLGTSLEKCIELAGGAKISDYAAVIGGPMMGKVLKREELSAAVVTKTTSGLILLPSANPRIASNDIPLAHTLRRAATVCIRCSFCTGLCPRYLLGHPLEPHKIMSRLAGGVKIADMLDDEIVRSAQLCCECGICEIFACPMQLQPRRVNAAIKCELAAAGIRGQKGTGEYVPDVMREYRQPPTGRIANRAGVGAYYHTDITDFEEFVPDRVEIALNSHIGAAAQPAVGIGDSVLAGQLIATCPEGKLGANYHASISGTVVAAGSTIVIERVD